VLYDGSGLLYAILYAIFHIRDLLGAAGNTPEFIQGMKGGSVFLSSCAII